MYEMRLCNWIQLFFAIILHINRIPVKRNLFGKMICPKIVKE